MPADEVARYIDLLAPSHVAFLKRWGLSVSPMHTWRLNGAPSVPSYCIQRMFVRVCMIAYPDEALGAEEALKRRFENIAEEHDLNGQPFADACRIIARMVRDREDLPITHGRDMTPDSLAIAMDLVGHSAATFAEEIGAHVRTVNRWLDGSTRIFGPLAWKLRSDLVDAGHELDFGNPALAAAADLVYDAKIMGWTLFQGAEAIEALATKYRTAPHFAANSLRGSPAQQEMS